ncbi:MAG: NADH-quinone oxidoreductase subunit J [Dehalococcoidia bacterium]|nr:NADH-quinone oxidoreductase subunit J [Dehalococcoidia bacterium]MDW8119097.1 NADH-quinone oxidoreductase subunit J [Chloroflexota bacterium]
MSIPLLALALLAAVVLGGGIGVVVARNVVHAALFLLLTLAGVAGVFVLLLAEFLALVQVLIYGGAVVIVLVFALMLTRAQDFAGVQDNPQWALGLMAAIAVLGVLTTAFVAWRPPTQPLERVGFEALGRELFLRWAIPFEIISLVLLLALIGAMLIARERNGGGRR